MKESLAAILLALLCLVPPALARGEAPPGNSALAEVSVAELPAEARETISLIRKGGPFPFPRDGAVCSILHFLAFLASLRLAQDRLGGVFRSGWYSSGI